ncbi:hypothetical protein [Paenibacillus polysaccharolyticus]|uniref:hypothetical protein n=1 Tax=Paenibacillus polysaccharolyticus TaxID=582692 RepID=UPI00300B7063
MGYRNLFIVMSGLSSGATIFLLFTVLFKINPVTEYTNSSFGQIKTMGYDFFSQLQRIAIDPTNIVIAGVVLAFSMYCMMEIKRYQTS